MSIQTLAMHYAFQLRLTCNKCHASLAIAKKI